MTRFGAKYTKTLVHLALLGGVLWLVGAQAGEPRLSPEIRFDTPFERDNPLSHQLGGINDIVQDHKGFIWLAAENGVGRYDGRQLRLYQADPHSDRSLPASYVRQMVVDEEGVLWLATEGGLARYHADTDDFSHITHIGDQAITAEALTAIGLGSEGTLYTGSSQGLLFYTIAPDRESMREYRLEPPFPEEPSKSEIRDITPDGQGGVWIATAGMGAVIYDRQQRTFDYLVHEPDNPDSPRHNSVRTIMHDNQGRTWMGFYGGGISRLEHASGKYTHFMRKPGEPRSLRTDIVWDVTQDSTGQIWIAMDQGGLALYDEASESFSHYRHAPYDPNSLISDQLRVVYEDQNQDLWMGAFPSGVSFYNRSTQAFRHYTSRPDDPTSLSDNAILTFTETDDGTIWVGTEGGLNALNPETGQFTRYLADPDDPDALAADPVLAIEEDRDGQLWVGTWAGGLHRLDRDTGRFTRYQTDDHDPRSLNSDFVWELVRDHRDRLWIATETGGLNRYHRDSDDFSHFVHNENDPNSLSGNFVFAMIEDSRQQLWLGTINGLNILREDSGTFRRLPYETGEPDATSSRRIKSLYEDSRGRIWVGTHHHGANVYDPQTGTFDYINVADGLPSSNVSSIVEDDGGNVWLATTNGLARVDDKTGDITAYRREDGLAGSNFNRDGSLKDRHGNLYFGSSEGITTFHPDNLAVEAPDYSVHITNFRILNEEVPIGGPNSPLSRSILTTEHIALAHSDTMFSFDFAALNYRHTGSLRYSYKLEGFDRDWHNIGQNATATYTNLDPGEYRFRVRASHDGDKWVEGQNIAITIAPPPWRTWWAYVLYALGAALLLYFRHRFVQLRGRAEDYRSQSITDPLTGLYNRLGIAQVAEGIFANTETRREVCVMLMDIDHFKLINDEQGHDCGDRVLCEIAAIVRSCIRHSDHFGRWGGEEFVLLCASPDREASLRVAEKIRAAVEQHTFEADYEPTHVTLSIGVADIRPEDDFETALKRADNALYQAKASGRNCVLGAEESPAND